MVERELNKLIIIKPNDFERRRNAVLWQDAWSTDEEKETAEEEEQKRRREKREKIRRSAVGAGESSTLSSEWRLKFKLHLLLLSDSFCSSGEMGGGGMGGGRNGGGWKNKRVIEGFPWLSQGDCDWVGVRSWMGNGENGKYGKG